MVWFQRSSLKMWTQAASNWKFGREFYHWTTNAKLLNSFVKMFISEAWRLLHYFCNSSLIHFILRIKNIKIAIISLFSFFDKRLLPDFRRNIFQLSGIDKLPLPSFLLSQIYIYIIYTVIYLSPIRDSNSRLAFFFEKRPVRFVGKFFLAARKIWRRGSEFSFCKIP